MNAPRVSDLLTVVEFAKEIEKGPRAVLKMIDDGEITAEDHRSPGSSRAKYRIARSEAARWRQSRRTVGTRHAKHHQQEKPRRTSVSLPASGQTTAELFV